MPIHLDNIHFAPQPSGFGPTSGSAQPSQKRESFFDYFPIVKENYKGYIKQNIFEGKMKEAIRQSIESVKRSRALSGGFTAESSTHPILSDQIVIKKVSFDQTGLDKMNEESTMNGYYEDIRTELLHRVWGEEWRTPNEMNMSRDMYAQSNNYFKSAGKEAVLFGLGEGIGKAFGKLGKAKPIENLMKRTDNGLFSTSKRSFFGKYPFSAESKYLMNVKNKNFLFQTDIKVSNLFSGGKVVNKVSYSSLKIASVSPMEAFIGEGLDKGASHLAGIDTFDEYNCMNFSYYGLNKYVNKGVDIASGFIPYVNIAKTINNVGWNTLLGFQTRAIANRMKDVEDKSNAAERNFNQRLKQTIYDDVDALSFKDIGNLIEVAGLIGLTR